MHGKAIIISTLALLLAAAAIAAHAQPYGQSRMYGSVTGGVALATDSDFDDPAFSGEISYEPGLALLGALGAEMAGTGVRLEGELGLRYNEIDEVSFDGLGSASLDGDATALSIMFNGYYDFGMTGPSPFIMAGVGFADVEFDADDDDIGSSDDDVLAYQFGAGVALPIARTISIDGSYRYFATSELDIEGTDVEYATHNLLVTLRAAF